MNSTTQAIPSASRNAQSSIGRILSGDRTLIQRGLEEFSKQPIDLDFMDDELDPIPQRQRTIAEPVTVSGPGTFFGKATRTITFEPTELEGWWFDRSDLEDTLPVRVSIRNVWTTGHIVSNIVLRSGPPQNYIRMVEHIIALRLGMNINNLMIHIDSGDPPLFDQGSMDLVEALESAGTVEQDKPVRYFTVREPVTVGGPHGNFVTISPCTSKEPRLNMDCAINFTTAIGKQRIRFPLSYKRFRHGADARTNAPALKKIYCQTIGKLFADVRNLGYTNDNLLIAGKNKYWNEPRHVHNGKSLEAIWHRSTLDLLAALALVEEGRLVGDVTSYKAGHGLDARLIVKLYQNNLLVPFEA